LEVQLITSKIWERNSVNSTINPKEFYGILQAQVCSFMYSIKEFSVPDDPSLLLGPEKVVAKHNDIDTFYANAYRDIFDKKRVEQQLLGYYISGFSSVGFLAKT